MLIIDAHSLILFIIENHKLLTKMSENSTRNEYWMPKLPVGKKAPASKQCLNKCIYIPSTKMKKCPGMTACLIKSPF